MTVITPDFVQRIVLNGSLAEAQKRLHGQPVCPKSNVQWDKFSSWSLICEEVLDTEHDLSWYDDVLAELTRRGFSHSQINRMRAFAWQTAGWLNFDKMLWEWVSLDEDHIRMALDCQLKEGLITPEQHSERLSYIENPDLIPTIE